MLEVIDFPTQKTKQNNYNVYNVKNILLYMFSSSKKYKLKTSVIRRLEAGC